MANRTSATSGAGRSEREFAAAANRAREATAYLREVGRHGEADDIDALVDRVEAFVVGRPV